MGHYSNMSTTYKTRKSYQEKMKEILLNSDQLIEKNNNIKLNDKVIYIRHRYRKTLKITNNQNEMKEKETHFGQTKMQ